MHLELIQADNRFFGDVFAIIDDGIQYDAHVIAYLHHKWVNAKH